jgi:uncharacterized protein (DUF4213/DUF364 family)
MKIIDDLLNSLDYGATLRDIRQGPFQTAVLSRYCGLASTLRDMGHHHHHHRPPVAEAGHLLEKTPTELSRLIYSENTQEAAIGLATINSLLEVDETRCQEINAGALLAEKGKGKRVAIIGHFPFVPELRKTAQELWVFEQNPAEGDLSADEEEKLLPKADVVGITGTALTNHTIESLLALCDPKAYLVLLGDSAPLSPLLFNYGLDAVSGTRVVEPETALRCVSQGATFRQIRGIRLLTMQR